MVERGERPNSEDIEEIQQRERAEFRANLEEKLSDDAIERLEIMDELWETGKMQEMIDSGDFSDLPDEFRPDDYDGSTSRDCCCRRFTPAPFGYSNKELRRDDTPRLYLSERREMTL